MAVHSPAGEENTQQGQDQAAAAAAAQAAGDPAAQDQQQQGGGDAAAQSSSAQDATEATLQEVIAAAVKPKGEQAKDPGSSDRDGGQEADKANGADAKGESGDANPDDKTPKDDSELPFHKHPRWQEVLRERDSYRAGHEQYEQIQSFMKANQLAPQEVADGFEVMALIRRDPEKALEKLLPLVRDLELVTGRRLPDDLQKRVDDAVLDRDTAQETARLRIEKQQREAAAQSTEQTQQQQMRQQQVQQIQAAVATVEQEIQSGDPDYQRKQPFVMDRVRALIIEKQPRTPEDATAIVRQAHKEISEQLKPMVQQRKTVTTTTSGDTATSSRAAPTSLLEVVQQAANQSSR